MSLSNLDPKALRVVAYDAKPDRAKPYAKETNFMTHSMQNNWLIQLRWKLNFYLRDKAWRPSTNTSLASLLCDALRNIGDFHSARRSQQQRAATAATFWGGSLLFFIVCANRAASPSLVCWMLPSAEVILPCLEWDSKKRLWEPMVFSNRKKAVPCTVVKVWGRGV